MNLITNLDQYIEILFKNYEFLTYILVFLVVYLETAFIFMGFLPTDSILLVFGTIVRIYDKNIFIIYILMIVVSTLGDLTGYLIGKYIGNRLIQYNKKIINENLYKAEKFYNKYGIISVTIKRFVPFLRTFIPFFSGVIKMNYRKFLFYDVLNNIMWSTVFLLGGYFMGVFESIQKNIHLYILGIIIIFSLPTIFIFAKYIFDKMKGILWNN